MDSSKRFNIYSIVTLLFLLLTSNANVLNSNDIYWFVILVFMAVVALSKKLIKYKDFKTIAIFSVIYLIFVCLRDIFVNGLGQEFIISDVLFLFKYIFLAFFYCVIMKEKLATYLVSVTIPLIIISVFFYCFQLVGLGEIIYSFATALNLPNPINTEGYSNFIIFTYNRLHEFRNSGFFWEPGAYACFLTIVLLLNLFLNNFKFDRRTKIILVGIITTLSTTGYLAVLVIIFLWYRRMNPKINFWIVFLIPVTIILIMNIPILGDKISNTFNDDMKENNVKRLNEQERFFSHQQKDKQIPLNRFSSALIVYETFGGTLFLGESNKYDAVLDKTYNVNISNGIFDFLAKFGLVGLILIIYRYSRFCLFHLTRPELLFYCILVFLIIGTGEAIVFMPFILMFLFIQNIQVNRVKTTSYPTIQ